MSKDPQIFGSAIVHFGGGENNNEVDSSPTMEIRNVKFCNGKLSQNCPKTNTSKYSQLISFSDNI